MSDGPRPLPDYGLDAPLVVRNLAVDVVVSSLAFHDLPSSEGRRRAITEIDRVLRPGGRVALLDLRATGEYEAELRRLGWCAASRSPLRGSMFPPVRVVRGTKPDRP